MEVKKFGIKVTLDWSPVTDDGLIKIGAADFAIKPDGTATGFQDPSSLVFLFESIQEAATRELENPYTKDPITQEDLPSKISGLVVLNLFKQYFEDRVEEHELEMLEEESEPEPDPEPDPDPED